MENKSHAFAAGLFALLLGLAALLASVTAGVLWDRVSERAPYVLGAVCAGLAAMALSGSGPATLASLLMPGSGMFLAEIVPEA